MEESSRLPLPDAFLDFLLANGLDPSMYTASDSTPRYVRLKPSCEDFVEEIEDEMKCKLEKVGWLPGFYSLPPDIQIASSRAYREGKMYGIDAASGAAVRALDVSAGDHVLDLCAAPGAKLCMIADILGKSGSVTGVDVASQRMAACRTLLQKYALGDRCRLFVADGTTFALLPVMFHSDSKSCESAVEGKGDAFREWKSRRPYKERKKETKAMKTISSQLVRGTQNQELIFYGRHSGVVGLTRSELYQPACECEVSRRGYDKLRLLSNGFNLLKVGGSLIYSTCSLTVAQNEDVVEQFLKEHASADTSRRLRGYEENPAVWKLKGPPGMTRIIRYTSITRDINLFKSLTRYHIEYEYRNKK